MLGVCNGKFVGKSEDTYPSVTKIGGSPAFYGSLNHAEPLVCKVCLKSVNMVMVAQVYAPTDFDRTLYIFACNSRTCSLQSRGWQVYRNQRQPSTEDIKSSRKQQTLPVVAATALSKQNSAWTLATDVDDFDDIEALLAMRDEKLTAQKGPPTTVKSAPVNKDSKQQSASSSAGAKAKESALLCPSAWPAWAVLEEEEVEAAEGGEPPEPPSARIEALCAAYLASEEDARLVQVCACDYAVKNTRLPAKLLTTVG